MVIVRIDARNTDIIRGMADELQKIAAKVPGWVVPASIGAAGVGGTAAGAAIGHGKGKKKGRREGARVGLRVGHRAGMRRGYHAGRQDTVRQLRAAVEAAKKAKEAKS